MAHHGTTGNPSTRPAKGVTGLLAVHGALIAMQFLNQVLIARNLDPSGFGAYAFALAAASVAATIGRVGAAKTLFRYGSDHAGEHRNLGRFVGQRVLAVSILGAALAGTASFFLLSRDIRPGLLSILASFALIVIGQNWLHLRAAAALAQGSVYVEAFFHRLFPPILTLAMLTVLIANGLPLSPGQALLIVGIAWGAPAAALTLVQVQRAPMGSTRASTNEQSQWRRFAGKAGMSEILHRVRENLEVMALPIMLSTAAAGSFAIGLRLGLMPAFALMAVTSVFGPRVARARTSAELDAEYHQGSIVNAILSGAAILAMVAFHPTLLQAYGPDYSSVGPLLLVVLLGQAFFAVGGFAIPFCQLQDGVAFSLRVHASALGIAALALIPLTHTFGALGAAMAHTTGAAILVGPHLWQVLKGAPGLKRVQNPSLIVGWTVLVAAIQITFAQTNVAAQNKLFGPVSGIISLGLFLLPLLWFRSSRQAIASIVPTPGR